MSDQDVRDVFGPDWVQKDREYLRGQLELARKVVISLRRLLRGFDPSLPHELDGTAWAEMENVQVAEREGKL